MANGGVVYPFAKWFKDRYMKKGQIEIGMFSVKPGVRIVHSAGAIIVNLNARIGYDCFLSPGVIVGISSLYRVGEVPIIGNNVYLAPNAKVFGKCKIGDNVIIGTDTVIRDTDIPYNCFAVGNPIRIIPRSNI